MSCVSQSSQVYLAIFLLACGSLFGKWIIISSTLTIFVRGLLALPLIFLIIKGWSLSFTIQKKHYIPLFISGVGLCVHWVGFFESIQQSNVATGVLLYLTFPCITSLLDPFFSNKRLSMHTVFEGLLIILGVSIISYQSDLVFSSFSVFFWGVFSALGFSIRNLISKYYLSEYPAFVLMFFQILTVVLLLSVEVKHLHTIPDTEWIKLVILVIGFTVISHTLYLHVITTFSVTTVSLLTGLEPVIAIFLSWLLLGEVPSLYIYLGSVPILAVVFYESFRLKVSS